MDRSDSKKTKKVWLYFLILLLCVTATTVVFMDRMGSFLLSDKGAISLVPDDGSDDKQNSTGESGETNTDENGEADKEDEQPPKKPGFQTSDEQQIWSTDTKVEIFRVSYANGEQIITVNSDNGDKLIAPGTENSYVFKLKNTGEVPLDYSVDVDAFFTPGDIEIPIEARINRYDGKWIVGNKDDYASVSTLNDAKDSACLGVGRYTYYTLDWQWPFESGNDEMDTMLGNLATEEDLVFKIVIKTRATECPHDGDHGIVPPSTGELMDSGLWIIAATGSLALLLVLVFGRRKEEE